MRNSLMITGLAMLTLSACSSSATLMRTDARGGNVQLQGAYVPAMSDARMLMVEHCQGRFTAIEHADQIEFQCTGNDAVTGRQYATR